MYYVSRIAGLGTLIALGVAVWFSIVLARADHYFRAATPEAVARAVEIAPRNTEYLALRALQLDYDGADSTALMETIARLNPLAAVPRIRLGLAAEVRGDTGSAERWLLEAARVDHQYEPRWTLANFFFRQEKPEEFWTWMRLALQVSYGDRSPAFDLCRRASQDAAEILRVGIPDRHEVLGGYLGYLLHRPEPPQRRLQPRMAALQESIVEVARRLAGYRDESDLPLLYEACDYLVAARDPGAVEVWVLTGHRGPVGVFNGDFSMVPLDHGFDWRLVQAPGITHVTLSAPAGHRVVLNGQQPESSSLLGQTLHLEAGKRYRLQWEARTAGLKSPSGLEWRLGGQSAAVLASEDWAAGEMTLTALAEFDALELTYQRPIGQARAQGSVELRNVRAGVAP